MSTILTGFSDWSRGWGEEMGFVCPVSYDMIARCSDAFAIGLVTVGISRG